MKLHRTLNRPNPGGDSSRAEEAVTEIELGHGRRENRLGSGNVLQDVWEATQRTVRLMKPGSGNRHSSVEIESDSELRVDARANQVPSKSGARRNVRAERRSQFQLVMTELKVKARTKNAARKAESGECKKDSSSPTNIQDMEVQEELEVRAELDAGSLPARSPLQTQVRASSSSSENEESRGGKKWIARTPVLDMVTPRSKRRNPRSRSVQLPRVPMQQVPPLYRGNPNVNDTRISGDMDANDSEASQNSRKPFRLALDPNPLQRMMTRGILPFKRRGGAPPYARSKSISNEAFHSNSLLEELDSPPHVFISEPSDDSLEPRIQKLVATMETCERKLARVRIEAEKNRLQLQLEVSRLQNVVSSFSKTQELRYRALLEGIDENYRALAQVQSSVDHFFSLLNHTNRSTFLHRVKSFFFFLLDSILEFLLSVTQAITRVYCRYRLGQGTAIIPTPD